jgi:succinoglycan biosynthesis protein ExoM
MRISVCICTFKRPMVVETIRSILSQKRISLSDIEIIVCDDDPQTSARELVLPFTKGAPTRVNYIVSGASNVAVCRNACMAAARGDSIAFIDDDEIAESDWLAELMSTQAYYAADVVKGVVRAIYPPETPRWIVEGDPFTRDHGHTGTPVSKIGTGNVLFLRDFALSKAIKFDPRLGQTGSEDLDFFRRFHDCGARMVSSRTAIVNEIVPPSRVIPRSLSHRFRRQGRTLGRAYISKIFSIGGLIAIITAISRVMLFAIYPLMRCIPAAGALRFKLFRTAWYHIGVLEGIIGRGLMTFEP